MAASLCCQYHSIKAAKHGMSFHWRTMLFHTSSTRGLRRRMWTEEEDNIILRLVNEKGNVWTEIADILGIKGRSVTVKRRWESLQDKCKSYWTGREDKDLEHAVNEYIARGGDLGERGSWMTIADMLKTHRTPHQCFTRWTRAQLPRQGVRMDITRFENVRGWSWKDDEVARLRAAISSVTRIEESNEAIESAEKDEPWLLDVQETETQRTPQYWVYVASKVGTRSATQCMNRSRWMNAIKSTSKLDINDVKRLIRLVKMHGTRWTFFKSEYFPDRKAEYLRYTYNCWKQAEEKLGVGFLDIDPFPMLKEFQGKQALRPTGADGNYDPNGELITIAVRTGPSIFTPYYLALQNISRLKIIAPIAAPFRDDTHKRNRQISSHTIEKLFKAITEHKSDWVSISRDVGMSISECRKHAEKLGSIIVSIREAVSDSELQELSRKASRSESPSKE